MHNTTIHIKTDLELKKQAESIFTELGMNTTTAINIFLRAVTENNGIPFEVKLKRPNRLTAIAIKNTMLKQNGNTFKDVNELMKDLEN